MIARTWVGRTTRSDADAYGDYLERTGLRELTATEGNPGVYVLRRIEGQEAELTLVSLWRPIEDVRRFAGLDADRARYYQEDGHFLEMPERVLHYDVLFPASVGMDGSQGARMRRERDGYRAGARAMLPLAVPIVAFGASFGALARAAGMGWLDPVVMSATTFAGSAQFAAVSILGGGGGVAAAVAAALLLNARYAPIGLSVAHVMPGRGWRRFVRSQLIVDESWAVARTPDGFDGHRLVGAGLVLYVVWVGGTLLGTLGGRFLHDPEALGLDAAFPAIFLAIVAPQLATRRARLAALGGMAIALALTPFAPAGVPIIAASAGALVGWRAER